MRFACVLSEHRSTGSTLVQPLAAPHEGVLICRRPRNSAGSAASAPASKVEALFIIWAQRSTSRIRASLIRRKALDLLAFV